MRIADMNIGRDKWTIAAVGVRGPVRTGTIARGYSLRNGVASRAAADVTVRGAAQTDLSRQKRTEGRMNSPRSRRLPQLEANRYGATMRPRPVASTPGNIFGRTLHVEASTPY